VVVAAVCSRCRRTQMKGKAGRAAAGRKCAQPAAGSAGQGEMVLQALPEGALWQKR